MSLKQLRPVLTILVLIATSYFLAHYFSSHPAVRKQLAITSLGLLVTLVSLYVIGILALAAIVTATLRLCDIRLELGDSFLVTAYSSVINFFGPLQSGPAFRAVYLKAKHNVNLKRYAGATFVYYFFYAGISGLMLLYGVLHWWLGGLAVVGMMAGILLCKTNVVKKRLEGVTIAHWYWLALATGFQIAVVLTVYFLELRSIAPSTHFSQAVIYTGAANLSLFVSITPGAIGFRESFLLFSQHLHHVSNATIVAVSILDRGVYIMLMLLLGVAILATHARQRLTPSQVDPQ